MQNNKVVSREKWIEHRKILLTKEKELTRLRDQLSSSRRELPWVKVEKDYVFDSTLGKQSLLELFDGKSQLIVNHFMFHPDWDAGCKSCSFWADNYSNIITHLNHRDVNLVAISRAPLEKLAKFKSRMGWDFEWVSSNLSDFNYDYHVSFSTEQIENGDTYYNYRDAKLLMEDLPGISVFYKNKEGDIFHTYSCYSRGVDMLNGAYNYLDLVPKGRDEQELQNPMSWLKLHDNY